MKNFTVLQKIKKSKTFKLSSKPKTLHQRFVALGKQKRKLEYHLQYLLPLIKKSEVYKKHAQNIYQYAGRFGGIPSSTVEKILRTEENLENKPLLKEAIKDVGIHKVSLVATLATPETDKIWAQDVRNLSKAALIELSKELRDFQKEKEIYEVQKLKPQKEPNLFKINNLQKEFKKPELQQKPNLFNFSKKENILNSITGDGRATQISITGDGTEKHVSMNSMTKPCKARATKIRLELDEDQSFIFMKFKKHLENLKRKETKALKNSQGFSNYLNLASSSLSNQEVLKTLTKIMEEMMEKETKSIQNLNKLQPVTGDEKGGSKNPQSIKENKVSRYIPKTQKLQILKKYKHQCCYPNCNKPAEHLHHRIPFAQFKKFRNLSNPDLQDTKDLKNTKDLKKLNNSNKLKIDKNLKLLVHESVVPICKLHHQFAHAGLIKNQTQHPRNWKLNLHHRKFSQADKLFLEYKGG